ncbi:hypothetical protein RND71_028501 [Anisodus tanguticus]|uniref:60S ribosomal protein L27 n=1 Tax=Anisodus tanguticus TaxID=243964 RepID=A0AAE1RLC1_9SOLA|nr:hypothetical protein RND71_028501 [Anisodus tanguticus]
MNTLEKCECVPRNGGVGNNTMISNLIDAQENGTEEINNLTLLLAHKDSEIAILKVELQQDTHEKRDRLKDEVVDLMRQVRDLTQQMLIDQRTVILLQDRFAGRKAVIIKAYDEGTRDRPYGHCLVAGIGKYPKKVIRKDSAKKQAKKSRVKTSIKLVNYNHSMPTRYTLDVYLKDVVNPDSL